jgi:nitrite reductase/ring-hydroxylating ferredoxin subunit/uncharacterized membrane protein
MRSKASFDGHPLHTALIPFPFAFITGAFVFDAAGWLLGWTQWMTTGWHLAAAGVLTAFVAAVPGAIDYIFTVPPNSSGKKRATQHMLFNLSAVAIVIVTLALRRDDGPLGIVVLLEAIAAALLIYGSSMGAVLVTRNQISIDHRYAEAGKWKEQKVDAAPGQPAEVARVDELKPSQMKLLHVADRRIVLANTGEGYVAFDDRCTHRGGSLAGGCVVRGVVHCPWHGSQFDCRTGNVVAGPAKEGIAKYQVEERGGAVYLTL